MRNDDDVLGIDLDAWQAPSPPAGIADRVLERVRREATATTAGVPQALPVEPERRVVTAGKRWWIAGGAVLAAAAAATFVTFGMARAPASGQGHVVAARPAHLALGPSSAELDAKTVVSWRRDRHRITAHQAGGAATWRIAGDDILTIETALGSIEATNASLRVEVNMLDNSKAIAPSAVTAAAVAAVTIVVYQGAVSIREAGQPHEVVAGATYEIKAKREDVPAPELVGASSDLATTIRELEVLIAERQIEIDKLRKTLDAYEEPTPDLEPAAIQGAIIMRGAALRACTDVDLKLVVVLVVRPDGTVENVTAEGETSEQTECISRVLLDARFPRSKGGRIRYPLQIEAPPRAKSHANCDTLRERAMQAFAMGQHAAALRDFEAAYACKPDDAGLRQTVVAACKARNMAKARQYWARMNEQQRGVVLAVCAHHGMFREQLDD